ncbi:MAG: glycosyltransferase family protein [bacterium]
MKTGAIVQARLSSERLPGKVLLPLSRKPVLWHVLKRLKSCRKLDCVILATSTEKSDRKLKKVADELGIPVFFGSLNDVLARYYYAAKKYGLDNIVRVTADCPVIDPGIVDEVVERFIKGGFDYYGLSGDFPDGLDVTVYSFKALEEAFKETILPSEREHVAGAFIEKSKDRFKVGGYKKFRNKVNYRWTIDEPEDYEFLKAIFDELCKEDKKNFTYQDIFKLLRRKPELAKINMHIIRNEGYLQSLKTDKDFNKKNMQRNNINEKNS